MGASPFHVGQYSNNKKEHGNYYFVLGFRVVKDLQVSLTKKQLVQHQVVGVGW